MTGDKLINNLIMKIAFVTIDDASNILSWSGLSYYISKSLKDGGNSINYIGNLNRDFSAVNFVKRIFYSKVMHQKFPLERTVATSKDYAKEVAKRLAKTDHELVFSPGTLPIAYLKTDVPKVIYTDATFACMLGYYDSFNNLSSDTIRQGHKLEQQALDSCALAIYSSDWAANSAIKFYGADASKVKVVPFGANFNVHHSEEDVNGFIHSRDKKKLKILFNGVDWKRKGGDLVLSTVKEMRRQGVDVELNIVGIRKLPFSNLPEYVKYHGFLNKSLPAEKEKLESVYRNCHFLFLPSKAEAFGCVFCEAGLFGMPSITRKTGGLETVVSDGVNGFKLDMDANINDYASLILDHFLDYDKYIQLALSSYNQYRTRLNWKTAGESLSKYINAIK